MFTSAIDFMVFLGVFPLFSGTANLSDLGAKWVFEKVYSAVTFRSRTADVSHGFSPFLFLILSVGRIRGWKASRFDWENSRHIRGDVVDQVRRLKASDGPALHIWGSSELLQTLIVDEYCIWVFPLMLGEGKRLFESSVPPSGFTLIATRSTPKGVLINTYRSAGPVKTGSF